MSRMIRFVTWKNYEGRHIQDIFKFDLDKCRNKNRKFNAAINSYIMDALEKVVNGPFEITIEKGR